MLNVNCTTHFLTVEVKMAINAWPYDRGVPHNGVIIHDVQTNRASISGGCYFNPQSGWAVPIDANPGDFNSSTCSPESFQGSTSGGAGLGNAQFGPAPAKSTYTDAVHGITIKVLAQVTNGFTVNVKRTK